MAHVGLIRWLPFHGPKHDTSGPKDEPRSANVPVLSDASKPAPCYACELSSGKRALVTIGLVLFMAVFALSVYWTAASIDWRHQIGPFIPAWPMT